jgi:hypothetical protein
MNKMYKFNGFRFFLLVKVNSASATALALARRAPEFSKTAAPVARAAALALGAQVGARQKIWCATKP